jgi:iron complex outermembrane receptor protein
LAPVYDGSEIPAQADFDAARFQSVNEIDSIGYYINNQMEIGDLVLNAGVRFDDLETGNGTTSQDDSATSVSFGALYRTPIGLNPYVSYAESFQAVVGNDQVTNEPLLPQEGEQIEVGLKFQPPGTRTYVTLAYFDIEQSNLPNPAGLPNAPSQQEGVARIDGFELEAQTAIGDVYLDAAFSVLDTEDPSGLRFPSVPEVQGSAWASWRPSRGALAGFVLGGGVRYAEGNESQSGAVLVETDGYTVFDGLIGYEFDRYSITLNARNLFDSEFYGTCLARGDCFPGEVRTIQVRAGVRF